MAEGSDFVVSETKLPTVVSVDLDSDAESAAESPGCKETELEHQSATRPQARTLVGSPPPQRRHAATMARWSSWDVVGEDSLVSTGLVATSSQGSLTPGPQSKTLISTEVACRVRHSVSQPSGFSESQNKLSPQLSPSIQRASGFRRKSKQQAENPLHYPKNTETLLKHMEDEGVDLNAPNDEGDSPIHAIVRRKRKKRADLLMTLLVNGCSRVDVNRCSVVSGETALHQAVKEGEEVLVKMLLIFGAEVNPLNTHCLTPLDLAIASESCSLIPILVSVGGKTSDAILKEGADVVQVQLEPFDPPLSEIGDSGFIATTNGDDIGEGHLDMNGDCGGSSECSDIGSAEDEVQESDSSCANRDDMVFSGGAWRKSTLRDFEEGKASSTLFEKLNEFINCHLNLSESSSATCVDDALAMTMQQKEMLKYRKTQRFQSSLTRPRAGSRVLCLDGGGVRGLIQIEVLRQLELRTGVRVIDIFDWIVGTSTGAILALGLVYAKKNLSEMRQLYLKLRERVFSAGRLGMGYNTESFEKVLKEAFGTEALMSDVTHPKVLITAVYKKTNQPELHFFNNCFNNEFSKYPVWKVARYTSAAPLFFTEMDHYVDGGVLANNPCEYALTAISNFFRGDRGQRAYNVNKSSEGRGDTVALVVSIGTGIFPAEDLGSTDAQRFLYFGKHWFKSKTGLFQTVDNLITLLTTALMESEAVAQNCQSRLQSQGIPFFRFSPRLDEALPSPDVTRDQLLSMIMQTRYQTMGIHMDQLVKILHDIRSLMKKRTVQSTTSFACTM